FLSTPFGHFYVDAKRGKIVLLNLNGQQAENISETIGGKPIGMRNWFKEHLPFKILKYIPNIDTDNKFKGLGINMYYDSRFERVFITKKDYVLLPNLNKEDFSVEDNKLFYQEEEVFF